VIPAVSIFATLAQSDSVDKGSVRFLFTYALAFRTGFGDARTPVASHAAHCAREPAFGSKFYSSYAANMLTLMRRHFMYDVHDMKYRG